MTRSSFNVLIIGDLMLDEFSYFSFSKNSPEADCKVYKLDNQKFEIGGAGNLAISVNNVFSKCEFFGIIGQDIYSDKIKECFSSNRIKSKLFIDKNSKNTVKKRIYINNKQQLRLDNDIKKISKKTYDKFYNFLSKNIDRYSIIFVADYKKGIINQKLLNLLKKKSKGKFISIDTKDMNINKFTYMDLIKKNYLEYKSINNKKIKYKSMLITKSDKGMSYKSNIENKYYSIPGLKVSVKDVSGAGDASMACFTYCIYFLKMNYFDSLRVTNILCSYLVTQMSNCIADKKIIHNIAFFVSCDLSDRNILSKISNNTPIIFANGCFDLLHKGHQFLFKQLKKMNGYVVIGLNSDKSVKLNKGQDRPIESQSIRMKKILKLGMINRVITFEEKTPIRLIKNIIPDIIVKGDEYKNSLVVGSSYIKKFGGETRFIKKYRNYSTTNILNKK